MDSMYLVYFFLATILFFGASYTGKDAWNEEYTSLRQTKILQGITAIGIALHHMAQKTCAPWHPRQYVVHGLDLFVSMGHLFVAIFLFCCGLGLYKSLHSKQNYLTGFCKRRILPLVIAFFLSEWIYTIVRLLMGEEMEPIKILWYLSGLHMANPNAWYIIVIPFFYLVFWIAFRSCNKEGVAIFWVLVFTISYTFVGACIDHQYDWWMRGEWWYNSIILFPLGLIFGKYEQKVTSFIKKGYWFWLVISFVALFALTRWSDYMINNVWGYYGEWGDPLKIQHRLLSAASQWLVCIVYVAFWFFLMMKIKFGNKILVWMGSLTLEFYLMHGMFVEMFGYNFLDVSKSITYIKDVPVYMLTVLVCSVLATLLFSWLWKVTRKRLIRNM